MSPICLGERPRADGGVRPGTAGAEGGGARAMPQLSAAAGDSDSLSAGRVERLVDERVGGRVLRPRDAADAPAGELPERLLRGRVQGLHVRVLDLVLAVDLLGDELRVVDDLDLVGPQGARAIQPE